VSTKPLSSPFGQVHVADALALATSLPESSLDFIYIDPPFFTLRKHVAGGGRIKNRQPQDHAEFSDQWNSRSEYLDWLGQRVRAIFPALKPDGVFLLHLDWHAVHYAKVMCDQVFGEEAFQNELIWYYQTGGASKGRFSRKHDTILFYARGPKFYFDGKAVAIPRTPKALRRAAFAGARIAAADTLKNPDDVLTVPALNPMSRERAGYPTQKPVELLEKLILALCPPAGVVADFCCGSGTTLVAASRLGRQWVGCDVSPAAVKLAKARIAAESPTFSFV